MIRKKPAPDAIRGGNRLSKKGRARPKLEPQSIQPEAIALEARSFATAFAAFWTMLRVAKRTAKFVAILAASGFASTVVQAASATANLVVQMTITASCSINAAALTFPATAATALTSTAIAGSTIVQVNCTNLSPYSIAMSQGANYSDGSNRMASGTSYLLYGLYVDSAYTYPWTMGASNSTCAAGNSCYLGTGNGSAQTINVYGQVPMAAAAPPPGSYSDTVTMTVTY